MKLSKSSLTAALISFSVFLSPAAHGEGLDAIDIEYSYQLQQIGLIPEYPLDGNYRLTPKVWDFIFERPVDSNELTLEKISNPSSDGLRRYVAAYVGGPVYDNGVFNGEINVFSGSLDGNGVTLSGLNRPLFWKIEGDENKAFISNLTIQTQESYNPDPEDPSKLEVGLQSSYGEFAQSPRGVLANDISNARISDVNVSGSINAILPISNSFLEKLGGLAGSIENVEIERVTANVAIEVSLQEQIEGFSFKNAANYVGGLVGEAKNSTIIDSVSYGDVQGTRYVGGMFGLLSSSIVQNAISHGDVTADSPIRQIYPDIAIGGFAGQAGNSEISNSKANGDVIGSQGVGGFIGFSSNNIIRDSVATGTVNGEDIVGGFIGISSDDEIESSSSSGDVTGSGDTGSFVGRGTLVRISNSFALNLSPNELFGKILESSVINTFSFTLANPESWGSYIKFIENINSISSKDKLIVETSSGSTVSINRGQILKVSFNYEKNANFRLVLITPSGKSTVVGDLQVIEGKITLPALEFVEPGNYSLQLFTLIGFENEKVSPFADLNVEVK